MLSLRVFQTLGTNLEQGARHGFGFLSGKGDDAFVLLVAPIALGTFNTIKRNRCPKELLWVFVVFIVHNKLFGSALGTPQK
jgi:hypothetical protein